MKKFGSFRIDATDQCLWHDGKRVQITPKAFDVLRYLVDHPARLVTQDEILEAIWPEVYVNPEVLRKYILEIRKALDDKPDDPQFVETVPKRGYRFVAPVHDESTIESPARPGEAAGSEPVTETLPLVTGQREPEQGPPVVSAPSPTRQRKLWGISLVLGVLAVVLPATLIVGTFWHSVSAAKLTDKDTVVLTDFVNKTGDPIFDETLRQGLSSQLEQSPLLNLLSERRIAETLALMTYSSGTRLTGKLASDVCQRTASAATIEGSISTLGSQYVLGVRAVDCRSGDLLAEEQVTANGKEQVLRALSDAATDLRRKLGESLSSVQKYDAPAENVTTPSLDALQAYSLGYKAMITKADFLGAIPLFHRALSLDPNFAMAYARLGTCYANLGQNANSDESLSKAYDLRQRLSEREKLYITSHYEHLVKEDLEGALKTYELWMQTYPRDIVPRHNAAAIYAETGDPERAVPLEQEVLKVEPESGITYENLISSYLELNRLDEAKATARNAQAHQLDFPRLHRLLYMVDWLKHDTRGMEQEVAWLRGKPRWDVMLYEESDTAAYIGQFGKARDLTREAINAIGHSDSAQDTAAAYIAGGALREALVGNLELAKRQARNSLGSSKDKDDECMSAIALGLAGDADQATQVADDLARRFPQNVTVQLTDLPAIHGAIALGSGDAGTAVDAFSKVNPYGMGFTNKTARLVFYPAYLRGVAFLALQDGAPALAEFQKIIDSPGFVENEPIGALAYLGIGRAHALSNNRAKARSAYQGFFALWKNADSDIPILREAKVEYARLQ
ncbi:MAG TPA: winged helix-turn-helix domain-containing protein [Terriglobales bacterium]